MSLAIALGIGLLVGTERERRKQAIGSGPAGIRTFALVALVGGISRVVGDTVVVAAIGAVIGALVVAGYALSDRTDPGLTTEVALVAVFLLGALAQTNSAPAAALAVVVTVLLAVRERLHRFVQSTLTEDELRHGLILAASGLVVLPLLPDQAMSELGGLNPAGVGRLVTIVMAISGAGYVAVRAMGPSVGMPLAGFFSGFISSSATVAAMGSLARESPAVFKPAVTAAVLSSVATLIQLAVVVAATSATLGLELGPPLALAGIAAVGYAGIVSVRWLRVRGGPSPGFDQPRAVSGAAFDLRAAVVFGLTVSVVSLLARVAGDAFGAPGIAVTAALAGFVDVHAAAFSVAALVAAGQTGPHDAALPILVALTTNSITKVVLAAVTGRWRFVVPVAAGLILLVGAAWAGYLLSGV